MRRKISNRLIGIALFSIIVTTLVMTLVFYAQLKKQVFSDLETVTNILAKEFAENVITDDDKGINAKFLTEQSENLRVTVIEPDGSVAFDSIADESSLENHKNRPEISEAMINGCGKGERISDTLSESVYYYALKLPDGRILRVGKQAHSVVSVFVSAIPVIIAMTIIIAAVCLIAAHYLTSEIVQPIDEMAGSMDSPDTENVYPELRPFTNKIRAQHEEILATANLRQEFTANVSHELKTPLAAISGYAELMESGIASENDIARFSGEIRKSASRLLALINDIIKLSKLDAGNTEDVLDNVNLAEIARESVDMMEISAAKRDVTIRYGGADVACVNIGKEYAQELVFNLLENAVRYNRPGGSADVIVDNDDGRVRLTVSDTGIGIPKSHQERIFERFYRVDKSRSKELGGTGLGLAIVKHICMLTDGDITLESEEGKGTSVSVSWMYTK